MKLAIGGGLVVAVLGGAIVAVSGWLFLRPPPSDAALMARFRRHQLQFETLVAAAHADPGGHPAYSARLLRHTDVSRIRVSPDGRVWLQVMNNYDVRKGYVYATSQPSPLRVSLDGVEREVGNGYLSAAYRPIAPHWYLYLEARE